MVTILKGVMVELNCRTKGVSSTRPEYHIEQAFKKGERRVIKHRRLDYKDKQMIEMKKVGVCREVAIDKQSEKIMMDRHIFVKVNA